MCFHKKNKKTKNSRRNFAMNKNIIKLFAIVMMIFMIGAALVACGAGQKGDKGDQGLQGPAGVQGEQGEQGVAGLTPYIGANGNWWIGDEDLGVCPQGKDLTDCENHAFEYEVWPGREHTMTSEGLALGVCKHCGDAEWKVITHEFNIKSDVVAPNCTEKGYTVWACTCGLTENRDYTDPVGHIKGEKQPVLNDTGICDCEWTNAWFINCAVCDVLLEKGEDGAKNHSYTNWEPIIPDDDTIMCEFKEGKIAQCDNCDCHPSVIITGEARGHKEQEYTSVEVDGDNVKLSYTCDDCGFVVVKNVTLADCKTVTVAPTCTENGSETVVYNYTVYGAEKSVVIVPTEVLPAHGHTSVTVNGYAASCGNTGLTDGAYCSVCNETLVEQVVIPAVGHNEGYGLLGSTRDEIVIEIEGEYYDAYWCDVCKHWIAYQIHED
jgi:hypothetical protein